MMNSTLPYFVLGAYLPVDRVRYLFVVLCALLYAVILVLNWFLVVVIAQTRSLHKPMYLFMCSLFVNELYGSTGLFPVLLLQLPRDLHLISSPSCFLQIFCLHTYGHVEFNNLALMSYDRYLAICCPLQYSHHMTLSRAGLLIILVWLYSFLRFLITLVLNLRLTYCGNVINSVYCQNYQVAKLACSGSSVNNIYGLFGITLTVMVPLVPILFSYARILWICFKGSHRMRQKALNTCAPHLILLLNFTFGGTFEIVQSRFNMSAVPSVMRVLLSLYFLMIQPLLTPLMYGLQMTCIRNATKRLLCGWKQTTAIDQGPHL